MSEVKKRIKQVKDDKNGYVTDLTIGPNNGQGRSQAVKTEIAELAKLHNNGRSAERLRKNAMLAVQYRMEHYINNDQVTDGKIHELEDFVKEFLKVLNISKNTFAGYIEMDSANLNKYIRGERRFNTELALKFAYFFHTLPDLWLKVQLKNELLQLQTEKETADRYSKYDYEKLLQIA